MSMRTRVRLFERPRRARETLMPKQLRVIVGTNYRTQTRLSDPLSHSTVGVGMGPSPVLLRCSTKKYGAVNN